MNVRVGNEGNFFSPRGRTNMRKLRLSYVAGILGKFLTLLSSGGLTPLRDHYFKPQKEDLLVITEKKASLARYRRKEFII